MGHTKHLRQKPTEEKLHPGEGDRRKGRRKRRRNEAEILEDYEARGLYGRHDAEAPRRATVHPNHWPDGFSLVPAGFRHGVNGDQSNPWWWSGEARLVLVDCEPRHLMGLGQAILDRMTLTDLLQYAGWLITARAGAGLFDVLTDAAETALSTKLAEAVGWEDTESTDPKFWRPIAKKIDRMGVRIEARSPCYGTWSRVNKQLVDDHPKKLAPPPDKFGHWQFGEGRIDPERGPWARPLSPLYKGGNLLEGWQPVNKEEEGEGDPPADGVGGEVVSMEGGSAAP